MKALSVRYAPALLPEIVTLEFDQRDYRRLLACLRAHASNDIHNGYVVDCGTAATLLREIEGAVAAVKVD